MARPKDIEADLVIDLGNDISPEEFTTAIHNFFGYTKEVSESQKGGGGEVAFTVQVKKGSNLIGLIPNAASPSDRVDMTYFMAEQGIKSVANGNIQQSGLSDKAIDHLKALSDFSQKTTSKHAVKFWIKKKPIRIGAEISKAVSDDWEKNYHDFGTVEGRLEAIQDASGKLKVRIKDLLYPKAINCFVPEEMIETVMRSFRRRVEIEGRIHYRKNGTPISIEAEHIDLLPEDDELPSADDVRGIMATA